MSLDQNLFTLIVTPNKEDANVVDLVNPAGTIFYRKQRIPGVVYTAQVYDFTSQSLLCSATAPNASSKVKILELFNPSMTVELKYTGTLTFRWSFKFEEHEFEWKREECFLIRKPDPPVLVAITKEPPGRLKTSSVQILDYNLNRFDIDDRKGLEIVILTALLTFQDTNEVYHSPPENNSLMGVRRKSSAADPATEMSPSPALQLTPPPPLPPKPAPKTGVDRIAEIHALRGDVNEVTVEDEGAVDDYAQYVANLLEDNSMLFVSIRSAAAEHVPKVIQVVEETRRIRHRAGLEEESELHQYVAYDTVKPNGTKGPRRINLDDDPKGKNKYSPPNSLIIHLSKIPMPELQPKPAAKTSIPTEPIKPKKDDRTVSSFGSSTPSKQSSKTQGFFSRRQRTPSPENPHVKAHQVHPHQPSPSPAQLNNPMIYVAPPPPHHSSHSRSHSPSHPHSSSTPPEIVRGPAYPIPNYPSTTPMFMPVLPPGSNSSEPSLYGPFAPHSSHLGQGGGQPNFKPSSGPTGFFDMLRR